MGSESVVGRSSLWRPDADASGSERMARPTAGKDDGAGYCGAPPTTSLAAGPPPLQRADIRSGLRPIAYFSTRAKPTYLLSALCKGGGPLRLRNGGGLAAPWAAFPFKSICLRQKVSFGVRRSGPTVPVLHSSLYTLHYFFHSLFHQLFFLGSRAILEP